MTEPALLTYGREQQSRRRRALKRLFKWTWRIAAVVVVVIAIVHTAWLVVVTTQLNRAIAALAAAGEPTSPATLQPPVPPGRNAYDDLTAAGQIVSRDTDLFGRVDALNGAPQPPLFDFERMRFKAYVDDCAAAAPLVDAADRSPANVTPATLVSPILNQLLPQLNQFRRLAYFQAYRAQLAHDAGQDDEALTQLARLDPIAVASASHPSLVGMLVGVGIRAIQTDQLIGLAPVLRVGTAAGEARPDQVRATIAALYDFSAIDAELLTALRGERVMQIDSLQSIDNGTMASPMTPGGRSASAALRYGVRPYLRSNELTCVRLTTGVIGALGAPDWPAAKARLAGVQPAGGVRGPFHLLARILMPSFDRCVMAGYRIRTDRVMAAVALATRLHVVEIGRGPANWNDLVPRYLPTIPLDPLAANAPLGARFAGDDPVVWSVNENGIDDGGSEKSRRGFVGGWAGDDRVIHLAARPREVDAELRRLIDLDLDSPVATTRPPPPATAPTSGPAQTFGPDWDEITGLTAWAEAGGVAALPTRRDVFAALRFSFEDDAANAAAATQPATVPSPSPPTSSVAPAVHGVAAFDGGAWSFTIHADDTLLLTGPDGVALQRQWRQRSWQVGDSRFWR